MQRDRIICATVALLDEEGPDGLNMRSIGKRLDVAATAMYRHIGPARTSPPRSPRWRGPSCSP
ncbi:TetR/AcrR family transcriptional regulator [Nocardia jiangsuensis]|uniref:TetR/AcrR family transcriptional regulator n=1 Tax=Nocardia jiangsuensis TaxID=1691563 RepID=A0ABV8DTI5_9NOCA